MIIGKKSTVEFKPVHLNLSSAVYYKKQESDDWTIDHGLSKYQAKLRAQSYAEAGKIVEIRKE